MYISSAPPEDILRLKPFLHFVLFLIVRAGSVSAGIKFSQEPCEPPLCVVGINSIRQTGGSSTDRWDNLISVSGFC